MKSKFVNINANNAVYVLLKDKGIEHYVKWHNELMPFEMHTSFREFKSKRCKDGYHKFQLWQFINIFGNLGITSCHYFDLNLIFKSCDFTETEFELDQ